MKHFGAVKTNRVLVGAIAISSAFAGVPAFAAQAEEAAARYQNILGAASFCKSQGEHVMDWGGSWSLWNVDGCEIENGRPALNISIRESQTGRRGTIAVDLDGTDRFRGDYQTQTGTGSSSYYRGRVTLRFDDTGRAIGRWAANEGFFGGGDGPLEIRPRNSQRSAAANSGSSGLSPQDLLNFVTGIQQLSKYLDQTVQQGLISTLGEDGMKALASLASSGSSSSDNSESITESEHRRAEEESDRNRRFSEGWACTLANNCPQW